MNMRTRLFVQGAVLPLVALVCLVVVGGVLLRQALLRALDESLTAQAAVEAISLFDNAEAPHLHLGESPLRNYVESFVASRAVYGPDGAQLVAEVLVAALPSRIRAPERHQPIPQLRTLSEGQGTLRELQMSVASPDGVVHTLVLRSSLGRLDRTVETYFRVLGLGALLVAGFLGVVQFRLSRWWTERIHNMTRHTRRLAAGDLSSRPMADPYRDEIGELTTAIGRASERLEQARAAQDRLVADAAHELRTPLAAIRAEIDVTLRRPRETEVLRATLEAVREEADRLDNLSTRLLDLARIANTQWQMNDGDLVDLVEGIIEAHQSHSRAKSIRIEFSGPRHLQARFDTAALRQAIDNMLGNAVKFSPVGSAIKIWLGTGPETWRLDVIDEGPGIPVHEQTAVFGPFHRLDTRVPGAGLGLAIVRDVAQGHRGRVWIDETRKGTKVSFEAPHGQ